MNKKCNTSDAYIIQEHFKQIRAILSSVKDPINIKSTKEPQEVYGASWPER